MGERKLTIRDVARWVGVGVGTVSRVINDSGHVSARTRRRVQEAIEELGFRPHPTAQGLARGETQTIAVLVPFFARQYFMDILRGIERCASVNDYSLLTYNIERPEQAHAHLKFLAGTRRVDGVAIVSLSPQLVAQEYGSGLPFPVVCVDMELPGAATVSVDHKEGIYLAVHHLAELGHRRIAFIDRHEDPVSGTMSQARREGYQKACEEASLEHSDTYLVVCDYSPEGGYEAATRLLALPPTPTALACASDLQAIGVMRAVEERGLQVGVDVALTGYHDVEFARFLGLTTVRVPALEMGEAAANVLIDLVVRDRTENAQLRFQPQLVVRETCGVSRKKADS